MNAAILEFKEAVAATPPETYYDSGRGGYLVKDARGNWLLLNETQYKRVLKQHGLSNAVVQGELISPMDKAILFAQQHNNIHFAGPLAGYSTGYYEFGQHRVLVTESPHLLEAIEGYWNNLMCLVKGLLDDGIQLPYFYGWMKVAVGGLRSGNWLPGQALVFCGPHNCGKSLLQLLITLILGGRVAKPYQFMTGATSFNADLFGAEHLCIEDESPSTDMRARRAFGSHIKNVTVCAEQRMHAKYCTPITLPTFWRLTVSLNDEPENIQVLPPLDDSLVDKMIILKARRVDMPMPTATPAQRKLFWDTLVSEIPAFLAFLEAWEIPAELQSQRFGIKEYHNPEILALLNEVAPEFRLLALIDLCFFGQNQMHEHGMKPYELTAEQIHSHLTGPCSLGQDEARKVLSWHNAAGTYLGRLAKARPDRVKQSRTANSRLWTLLPPAENPARDSQENRHDG